MTTFERNFIMRALEKGGWNVTATARALGIPLSTLKFKMERLEIRELGRGRSRRQIRAGQTKPGARVRRVQGGKRGRRPLRLTSSAGPCLSAASRCAP